MIFKRTLHPVGQGAFFTEKIVDGKRFTSIVYDCGSTSSRDILYHEIEQISRDQDNYWYGPFNLMFISHFDNDHINGLKKLIQGFFVDVEYIEELYKKYKAILAEFNSSRWMIFRDKSDVYKLVKMCLLVKYPEKQDSKEMTFDDNLLNQCRLKKSLIYNLFWNIFFLQKPFKEYELEDIRTLCKKVKTENPPHVAVIIPFLYPNLIKALYSEMDLNDETKDALKALFDSGIKIIGLDDNGNPDDPYSFDIRPNDIDKEKLYEDDTLTIKSFTKIKVKKIDKDNDNDACWYYMPYNTIIDDGRKERFLVDLFETLMNSNGKIGDWFRTHVEVHNKNIGSIVSLFKTYDRNERSENFDLAIEIERFLRDCSSDALIGYPEMTDEFMELLSDLYKKASPGINGVTAINVNSLNVLSFCSDDLKESMVHNKSALDYSNQKFVIEKKFYDLFGVKATAVPWYKQYMSNIKYNESYNNNMQLMRFSCLYTGDCVMEDHFFSCMHFCIKVMNSNIGLLQIPHHGREGNYNNRVLSKPIYSSFINFNH